MHEDTSLETGYACKEQGFKNWMLTIEIDGIFHRFTSDFQTQSLHWCVQNFRLLQNQGRQEKPGKKCQVPLMRYLAALWGNAGMCDPLTLS